MTSILTNARAITALRTLGAVGDGLDTANRRVSTGARIGSAADGAAYWAIATSLKAENSSLAALTDAIALDQTAVDTASLGLTRTVDQLRIISRALVAAQSDQADRSKIQLDIGNAQRAMRSIAESSAVGGSNWLSVQSDGPDFSANRQLVMAFSRRDGSANLTRATIDGSQFILFDAKVRSAFQDWAQASDKPATGTLAATAAAIAARSSPTPIGGYLIDIVDSPTHSHVNGLLDTGYRINGVPSLSTAQASFSIATLDVSQSYVSRAMIESYARVVDATLQKVLDGAALLGSTSALLTAQRDFARQMTAINGTAIGTLVDADIEVESTRLKALQAQQMLGIRSLSIANAAPDTVLTLFN
ncbi:flagellin [Methylobacterium radiodurans]|nr:flagellin [Methylobacterium radiodurans]